jgi:hypothetical protein
MATNFTPQYTTEWNMNQQDIERFTIRLFEADELITTILSYPEDHYNILLPSIDRAYGTLMTLWVNIGTASWKIEDPKWRDSIKKLFEDAELLRRQYRQDLKHNRKEMPITLIWKLLEIHQKIIELKQKSGLGLILESHISKKEKLRKAFGISNKISERMMANIPAKT